MRAARRPSSLRAAALAALLAVVVSAIPTAAAELLQEALTIARFEPGIYEVVQTFAPIGEPN